MNLGDLSLSLRSGGDAKELVAVQSRERRNNRFGLHHLSPSNSAHSVTFPSVLFSDKMRAYGALGIADLPVETLERIAAWIDSPTDLLSLTMVTRTFKNIIIPNHLHYRHIRYTTDGCPELWKSLSSNKSLAQNVRKLEILGDDRHDMRPKPAVSSGYRGSTGYKHFRESCHI
jgi:hypothetical protein